MDDYSYRRALQWATALGGPLFERYKAKPPYGVYECAKARFDAAGLLAAQGNVRGASGVRDMAERVWAGVYNPGFQQIRLLLAGLTLAERRAYVDSLPADSDRYRFVYTVNQYMDRLPPAGIAAWDLGQLAFHIRCARLAGHIGENEENAYLLHNAVRVRFSYRSWPDYAVAYMAGKQYGEEDLSEERSELNLEQLRRLLTGKNSPWRELEWDIVLPEPPALPE